jgi:trans-aconitate 2-methyltransferase
MMTEKTFVWNSADYAKHSSAQSAWGNELIAKLRLQETESVLDIGCGDGKVTLEPAAMVSKGRVTGVDSSESMIESAKRRAIDSARTNVTFLCMDATALDFRDQFDAAFSNAALHWIKDRIALLEGVRKGLKKSGRILFQMGAKGNAKDVVETVSALIRKEKWRPYFEKFPFPYHFFGTEEYEQWLKQVGLVRKRLELIPKDMVPDGKEGFAGRLRSTWLPYTQRVPERLRETFVSELVDSYIQTLRSAANRY